MKSLAIALLTSLLGASSAAAQLPRAPAELDRLDFLLGEWEGGGWMEYAQGQRGEFKGTERVERRLGDRLVVLERSLTAWMGPRRGDVPVHEALGVFSWDPRSSGFVFRIWTARGDGGTSPAEVEDGRITWGYEDPRQGTIRYTITLTPEGAWHEVGDASRDGGETWHRFFEMTLAKRR